MVQIRELLFLMQRETLEKCAERPSWDGEAADGRGRGYILCLSIVKALSAITAYGGATASKLVVVLTC